MHASPVSTTPKQTIKSTATLKSSTTTRRSSSSSSATTNNALGGAAAVSSATPKGHIAGSTSTGAVTTTSKSKATTTTAKATQPSSGTMNNKTANAAAAAATNNSHEIEEISKKISEHADAIYRTWKSRGLAPTELLEFYTNAAAATVGVAVDGVGGVDVGVGAGTRGGGAAATPNDFFATSADVKTTEGLQQLVNTFVIKDKEQRGVKVGGGAAKKTASASGSVAKSAPKEEPVRISQNTLSLKGAKAIHGNAHDDAIDGGDAMARVTSKKHLTHKSAISQEPAATPARSASVLKSVSNFEKAQTAPVATAAASPAKEKPLSLYERKLREQQASAGGGAGVEPKKPTKTAKVSVAPPASTTPAATATATPTPTSNFDFDLHLTDVNDLSQLQTKNLQKIKELLQQEGHSLAGKPTTTTATTAKKKPQTNGIKLQEAGATTATATATSKAIGNESGTAATTTTRKTVKKSSNSATKSTKSDNKSGDVAVGIVTNSNSSTATTTTTSTTATNKVTKKSSKSNNVTVAAGRTSPTASLASPTATAARPLSKSPSPLPSGDDDDDGHGDGGVGGSMIDTGAFVVIDVVDEATKLATLASPPTAAHIKGNSGADKNSEPKRAAIQVAKLQQDTSRTSYQQHQQPQQQHEQQHQQQQQETIKIIHKITTKTPGAPKTSPKPSVPSSSTGNVVKFSAESPASPETRPEGSEAALVDPTPVMEVARTTMPTPTKFKSSRSSLTNGQDKNLGRPILTRGSVAERVMMFEKCPDARNSFLNIKRPDPADAPPKSLTKVKLHATPPPPVDHNSLQREIRSTKSVYIPRFYFPHGKPQPQIALERTLRGILSAFDSFPNNQVTKDELPQILKLCGIPFYWRMPVMVFCQQGGSGLVERQRFVEFWKQMNVYCHDAASRFVYILSRGQRFRSYILPEDLAPMVQDVVDTHPGLAFLKEATEFHSRYVHTVIARIFYSVNRSWSGRISIAELKKSDLLEIITMLEEEDDINQIMAFFSYEHFYVIYCKFWELDKDHDLLINQEDLAAHSDHALSTRIVERIFSGCVTRSDNKKHEDDEPKMSYTDFVWFLLSEEDKRTPTAIEYWFRCMDVDGDGVLSMYELEYFYEEQQQRMESIGIETLPFEDCLCQMLDMIKPQRRDCVTLGDLKRCRMTHVFFDTFFNLEKYLDHEQRDPFATQRDEYASDWDRFAAQEYELLITEEND